MGKQVIAPNNSLVGNKWVTHIRSEQIIDKEFKTKGGKLDVKILPGHQSELINNIHVVTTENKNSCIGCFVDQLLGESFLRYD